jgi:hypothetical protein
LNLKIMLQYSLRNLKCKPSKHAMWIIYLNWALVYNHISPFGNYKYDAGSSRHGNKASQTRWPCQLGFSYFKMNFDLSWSLAFKPKLKSPKD